MTEQEAERVTWLLPLTKGQLWICKREVDSAVGVTSGDPRDWTRIELFWEAFGHWDHWEDAVRSCRRAPGSPQLSGRRRR